MPLTISDEVLQQAGMSEAEARVEFACRLFDAGRLHLWPAAQVAGLSRLEFESELDARGIAIYRPTLEDLADDLRTLEHLGT